MAKAKSFEELEVWQHARLQAKAIYKATNLGSFAKDYGLRDQLRRAAVSVASNIAEGFERGGNKEFHQFLALAKGSCGEVRAQLYIAFDLGYLNEKQFSWLLDESIRTSRMIAGLMRYLRTAKLTGAKFRHSPP